MANRNKGTGTEWETRSEKFLRALPILRHARKQPARGAYDEGDIHAWPFVIQCKAVRRFDLAGWTKAAREQADRAHFPWSVVWIKKHGRPIGEGYAVRTIEEDRELMARLAELQGTEPPEAWPDPPF